MGDRIGLGLQSPAYGYGSWSRGQTDSCQVG